MAIDEALLRSMPTAKNQAEICLRFYKWVTPTLSLGYFQAYNDRRQHPPSQSCPAVRRSTGGGAILHDQEWTYSLVLPSDSRFHAGDIYRHVHQALVDVLADLGIRARVLGKDVVSDAHQPYLCFQRRSPGDVVIDDLKILGSAQRRVGPFVLQHGSLIFQQSKFAPEIPGVLDVTSIALHPDQIRDAWIARLGTTWNCEFCPSNCTDEERVAASQWQASRFEQNKWLQNR